jgi:hypothetical protein
MAGQKHMRTAGHPNSAAVAAVRWSGRCESGQVKGSPP